MAWSAVMSSAMIPPNTTGHARTVFDMQPFGPLDELAYAKYSGFLDAYIFTARPSEFAASRAEWARANPGRVDEYREWFLETFNSEPPGIRAN